MDNFDFHCKRNIRFAPSTCKRKSVLERTNRKHIVYDCEIVKSDSRIISQVNKQSNIHKYVSKSDVNKIIYDIFYAQKVVSWMCSSEQESLP